MIAASSPPGVAPRVCGARAAHLMLSAAGRDQLSAGVRGPAGWGWSARTCGDGDAWGERQGWERPVRTCEGTWERGALDLHQPQRSALPSWSIPAGAKVRRCRGSFWGALQVSPSPSYLHSEPSKFGPSLFSLELSLLNLKSVVRKS